MYKYVYMRHRMLDMAFTIFFLVEIGLELFAHSITWLKNFGNLMDAVLSLSLSPLARSLARSLARALSLFLLSVSLHTR